MAKLILYPDKMGNDEMTLIRHGTKIQGCARYIKMSSAYRVIWCLLFPTKIPKMKVFCLAAWATGSKTMSKSRGIKESPCLFPRQRGKLVPLRPLVKAATVGASCQVPPSAGWESALSLTRLARYLPGLSPNLYSFCLANLMN